MDNTIKQSISTLTDWVEENKNGRAVIMIASELVNETEKGFSTNCHIAVVGTNKMLGSAMKAALSRDDAGVDAIVSKAQLALLLESLE